MAPILLARFLRFDTLGASITIVLLGAGTADSPLSIGLLPGLLLAAVSFHVFAYLFNDVVDLPLDRTDPRRAASPLVTGLVSRRTALGVALVQVPLLASLVAWFDAGTGGVVTLSVLMVSVSIYDLWGKRCPLPPLTDMVQGVAWAALGWFGAELTGGVTRFTVVLASYLVVFILLANGVHGSVRDLANDRRHGARTTATTFRAGIGPGGAVRVAGAYLGYAMALHLLTVTIAMVPILLAWEDGGALRLAAVLVFGGFSGVFLVLAARAYDRHRQLVLGAWHLILVLASLFVMLAGQVPGWTLAVAVACYVLPFASYRWLFRPRPQPGTHWTVESTTAQ